MEHENSKERQSVLRNLIRTGVFVFVLPYALVGWIRITEPFGVTNDGLGVTMVLVMSAISSLFAVMLADYLVWEMETTQ